MVDAAGRGYSLGFSFQFLSEEEELAKGLGEGIGRIFPYISKELQEQMFEKRSIDAGFAHGLGYGMGVVFQFLSKGVQDRTFRKAKNFFSKWPR
jgi:hypothetical protein